MTLVQGCAGFESFYLKYLMKDKLLYLRANALNYAQLCTDLKKGCAPCPQMRGMDAFETAGMHIRAGGMA